MRVYDLLREDEVKPVWVSVIERHLEKGTKFYFASGANRIVGITSQPDMEGNTFYTLRLEHIRKKVDGRPQPKTYTVFHRNRDEWTLKKYLDGYRLVMMDRDED